ncbi:MAG: hypothetical protein U1A27_13700 [Phycisphaerae bacterium]
MNAWNGRGCGGFALTMGVILGIFASARAADPWADGVTGYSPGSTPVAGYTTAGVALGEPARYTADPLFPSVVSMFSPAFGTDQIVSVGEGGQLTLRFDEPVVDNPANPFGVDLIVFGNSGFIDFNFPLGQQGGSAGLFGNDVVTIELSADGSSFVSLGSISLGLFPTQGWLDVGPFDAAPGVAPSNFRQPVDPSFTLSSFNGLSYAQSLALYNGSGGGTPIDLAGSGLPAISYIRISVPDDGNPGTSRHAEIDAVSTVPEPASAALLLLAALARPRRRGA